MIRPLMPEGTAFGRFNYINAVIGLCVGWIAMGSRAGRGIVPGINNGFTGVVLLFIWGFAVHSSIRMFQESMKRRYDDPMEAFASIFLIASDFAIEIATAPVIITSIASAVVIGCLVEFSAGRWR